MAITGGMSTRAETDRCPSAFSQDTFASCASAAGVTAPPRPPALPTSFAPVSLPICAAAFDLGIKRSEPLSTGRGHSPHVQLQDRRRVHAERVLWPGNTRLNRSAWQRRSEWRGWLRCDRRVEL